MNLKEIAQEVLAGKLMLSEAELARERLKVCQECPSFKKLTRQCALCSCFMDLKTKLLDASCPIAKW